MMSYDDSIECYSIQDILFSNTTLCSMQYTSTEHSLNSGGVTF